MANACGINDHTSNSLLLPLQEPPFVKLQVGFGEIAAGRFYAGYRIAEPSKFRSSGTMNELTRGNRIEKIVAQAVS
jgi:hypothetical protein